MTLGRAPNKYLVKVKKGPTKIYSVEYTTEPTLETIVGDIKAAVAGNISARS